MPEEDVVISGEIVEAADLAPYIAPAAPSGGALEQRVANLPVPIQAAAVAATGFIAGAAALAVATHRRNSKLARRRRKTPFGEILSSKTFLVDVHVVKRR